MAPSLWLGLALALLLVGVVGSVTPLVPGPLLSVAGVVLYWWDTGYATPGPVFVGSVVVLGLGAVLVDWFGSAISTKAGGATTPATAAAALVGLFGFFVAGPLGVLVGVAVTVFAVEFYLSREVATGLQASLYATVGLLASTVVQALVTVTILVGFLLVVVV